MSRKHWIWITITIAAIHGLLTLILAPISMDVVFWRFEGNEYQSTWDPLWVGLYFLLHFPYFILINFAGPLRSFAAAHALFLVANSLIWGLMGAWLISKLPFMKEQETASEINTHYT